MLIFGDNGGLRAPHGNGWPMSSDWRAPLLVVTLLLSSPTLSSCCPKPDKPTIVGEKRVISVDQEAGTVTVSLSLWAEMAKVLRRCKEK